jgi:hypothetical protein
MEEIEKKTKTIIIKIKQDIKTNELCSYISLQCSVMFNCEFDLITMKMCDYLPSIILELYVCACFLSILAYNVTSITVACAKNMEAKRTYHIKVKQLWLT